VPGLIRETGQNQKYRLGKRLITEFVRLYCDMSHDGILHSPCHTCQESTRARLNNSRAANRQTHFPVSLV
jgi:hypothetical protein